MNSVRIMLAFDDEKLIEYDRRGRSPSFGIAWEIDQNYYYPDQYWLDFDATIIGFWANAVLYLARTTASIELLFMEGPAVLYFTHYHETGIVELKPKGRDFVWRTTFEQYTNALINASHEIQDKLRQFRYSPSRTNLFRQAYRITARPDYILIHMKKGSGT